MRVTLLTGAVLAMGLVGLARAQQHAVQVPADGLIAARQAAYDLMGSSVADMKRAVDAKVTDVKPFKANAEAIGHWAKAVTAMFPAGTEAGHDTHAKPEVWSDRAGFEKAAAALAAAADQLAKAADANDAAAFATAFDATGKACGGCHKTYRVKI